MATRILYCIDSIHPGGTETQLVGLVNRLDRDRFTPSLCTLVPSSTLLGEVKAPHIEIGGGRLVGPGGYKRVRRLAAWMKDQRIDIVQTQFQDSTILGIAAARMAGVPVRLVSFRDLGFWRQPVSEFLMRRVYPSATGFLANSTAVKNDVCRRDRLDPSLFRVISNGIDVGAYEFVEHLESEVRIGIVGNLNRRVKRQDLFLRAAARVAARHDDVTFHVIGDGEYRPEYEELARDLGLGERVVFEGRVDDVNARLGDLTVGVLCSDSEGLSNALLEYMLRGCAVVATAVGGNLDVVRDGETGLLVPPGNEIALASAISRYLDEKTLRLMVSMKARAMAEERFSWEACVETHQECYEHELRSCGVAC